MVRLDGLLCRVCGEKLFSSHVDAEGGPLCGLCRRAQPHFRQAVAYGSYDGALRDLIHLFKYNGIKPAGPLLGRLLHQAARELAVPQELAVIPVPLWSGKRHARGFNQAEAIARAFLRCRASNSIQLDTASLVRTRETAERIRGRSILLVDDVMTTGTTVGECARVLRRAGAKEVFVATVARATKEVESVRDRAAGATAGGTQGHA